MRVYLGKYLATAALLLLAAGLAVWFFYDSDSDETKIRRTVDQLAQALSKTPGESAATALLKVQTIVNSFEAPVDVAMGEYALGTYDAERLAASAGQYRTYIARATVSADDFEITRTAPDRAHGFFSGKFSGESKNGLTHTEVQDIEVTLVKIDGRWKIKNIRFRKVLH